MLSTKRLTPILLCVFVLLATIFFLNTPSAPSIPFGNKDIASPNGQNAGGAPATIDVEVQPPADAAKPPSTTDPKVESEVEVAKPVPSAPAVEDKKPVPTGPISYDKTTPPTVGCEDIVHDLQRRIIEAYQQQLKGIRYANVYGYLGK
jgi:hypothetical protein